MLAKVLSFQHQLMLIVLITYSGNLATIPAKIIIELPLPIPKMKSAHQAT